MLLLCEGRASAGALPRIDEHLDNCEACQQWIAQILGFADVSESRPDDTLHPTMLQPGTLAAERFRIVRFIKRGGMGEVYEAFDQVLEAPVALKTIISTACDNPRAIKKLKAEVQLARSIRHPNVCSVFDFWEHRVEGDARASVYFFTMELIEGETLGQRLKAGRMEEEQALRLARLQLCGLRAAHVSGVVHRDFKSDNIMLRSQRRGSEVVVMDFGLARLVPAAGGSFRNDSEEFAGSVAYMAPEQVEGRKNIGTEADVFSFGVVLFEMLTGELPFTGDSPWTTATRRLTDRPPAPSRLNPRVSPALDAFVLKCMRREPSERYKDATAALEALDRLGAQPRMATRTPRRWATSVILLVLGGIALDSLITTAPWRKAGDSDVARGAAALELGDVSGASAPASADGRPQSPATPAWVGVEAPRLPEVAPGVPASTASSSAPSTASRSAVRRHTRTTSSAASPPVIAERIENRSWNGGAPNSASTATATSSDDKKRPPGAPARLRSRFE